WANRSAVMLFVMPTSVSPRHDHFRAPARIQRGRRHYCRRPLVAPRPGLEPGTTRLTAGCSTIELSGIAQGRIAKTGTSVHVRRGTPSVTVSAQFRTRPEMLEIRLSALAIHRYTPRARATPASSRSASPAGAIPARPRGPVLSIDTEVRHAA